MDDLTTLNPATLAAAAKLLERAAAANRDNLLPGRYAVMSRLVLDVSGTVSVSEDEKGVSTPQKAKPWRVVHALLTEANRILSAANLAGIKLADVLALADKVDDTLADKARDEANEQMKALKEPTRQDRRGGVRVRGTCAVSEETDDGAAALMAAE